jgi:methionyl aminopeptidase
MSLIKTKEELDILRESGKRLARAVRMGREYAKPGMTTRELDEYLEKIVRDGGDVPSFKGYRPAGARMPFPGAACISVNDEIVHGIPGDYIMKEGDLVTIDYGVTHKGLITDHAVTFIVGDASVAPERVRKLLEVTERSLWAGIEAAGSGKRIGDISHAIEEWQVKNKFGNIRELGGHGVGHKVHEEPYVPNYGHKGQGPLIKPGMVLALEPMFIVDGTEDIRLLPDGYTIVSHSGAVSAHFEHTIAITEDGVEVLTVE